MINAEIFQVSTLVPDLSGIPYVAPLQLPGQVVGTSAQISRQKLDMSFCDWSGVALLFYEAPLLTQADGSLGFWVHLG